MAHRIATDLAHMPDTAPRAGGRRPSARTQAIAEILERAVDEGQESVERTPDLLPVLREAGVVDAGGHALTVIFAGVVAALRGTEAPELEHHAPGARHPPRARLGDLPLLHELRRHRHRPRPARRSATASRRSATPSSSWATSTR